MRCLGLPGEVGCQGNPRGCRSPAPLTPLCPGPELGTPQCLQFWVTEGTWLSSINCPIHLNEADSAA